MGLSTLSVWGQRWVCVSLVDVSLLEMQSLGNGSGRMTKSPKEQLSGLIKRRSLAKKRLTAAAKGIKRNGSLKDETWYERAQQRFAIATVKEAPARDPLEG